VQAGPLVVTSSPRGAPRDRRAAERGRRDRSRVAFLGLASLRGSVRTLKAGEYEVPRDASTLDILDLLESGRVRQHVILHPEGATVSELARALEASGWPAPTT